MPTRHDTFAFASVHAGGQRIATSSEEVRNPARLKERVGRYATPGADIVNQVVQTAEAAAPLWGGLRATERSRYLYAAADAAEREIADLVPLLTREQGKVLWESSLDLGGAPRLLRYYADLAASIDEEELRRETHGTTIIRRVPIGPTAIIVPWNYPVYLSTMVMAPALVAGNPVVVKPSEFAPLALTAVLTTMAKCLPEGVLNVLPGSGFETGAALVSHPRIRKVLFTGGVETGRAILHSAADNISSVSLELGGNDPALILESAVIDDQLVSEICRSVYTCSGQVCFNVKRIYVQRSLFDEFVDRFKAATDEIIVGDGLNPESTIGPLNNARQFRAVTHLLEQTQKGGGKVVRLGRYAEDTSVADGYFMLPSVVTDLPHESDLVSCEQFGPTVPIIPFEDEADAVRMANDTEFGLAASIWSSDIEHAFTLGREVLAGSVFVNSHRVGSSDMTMPFGGMKKSGLGRNHGMWAVDECSELQALSHKPDTSTFPGKTAWSAQVP